MGVSTQVVIGLHTSLSAHKPLTQLSLQWVWGTVQPLPTQIEHMCSSEWVWLALHRVPSKILVTRPKWLGACVLSTHLLLCNIILPWSASLYYTPYSIFEECACACICIYAHARVLNMVSNKPCMSTQCNTHAPLHWCMCLAIIASVATLRPWHTCVGLPPACSTLIFCPLH